MTPSLLNITAAPATANSGTGTAAGPWRPPQWGAHSAASPPVTFLVTSNGQQTVYAFDGIIRAEHEQHTEITKNPVQTGAAISDHAYVVPPRLTVEIRMSDAMTSWKPGQWADSPSTRSCATTKT